MKSAFSSKSCRSIRASSGFDRAGVRTIKIWRRKTTTLAMMMYLTTGAVPKLQAGGVDSR